jgi:hypothetical protein
MSYQDEKNEYWADRRCLRCDRHLDRRGYFCWTCEEERMDKLMEPWEFLNNELQKLFAPKK